MEERSGTKIERVWLVLKRTVFERSLVIEFSHTPDSLYYVLCSTLVPMVLMVFLIVLEPLKPRVIRTPVQIELVTLRLDGRVVTYVYIFNYCVTSFCFSTPSVAFGHWKVWLAGKKTEEWKEFCENQVVFFFVECLRISRLTGINEMKGGTERSK